jgi:hypothetical protein
MPSFTLLEWLRGFEGGGVLYPTEKVRGSAQIRETMSFETFENSDPVEIWPSDPNFYLEKQFKIVSKMLSHT